MNVSNVIAINEQMTAAYGVLGKDLVSELVSYAAAVGFTEDHEILLPAPYHYQLHGMVISPRTTSTNEDHIVSAIWGEDDRVLFVVEKIKCCACGGYRVNGSALVEEVKQSLDALTVALPNLKVELLYVINDVDFAYSADGNNILLDAIEANYRVAQMDDLPQLLNDSDPSDGLINPEWIHDVVNMYKEDPEEAVTIFGEIFK
ncbi:hypothetical protein DQR70_06015 [Salmonella enterica subsp. enterica serovar Oslo]|nr:hypothetical protein [Salmonella enterica subsp. enterica serovar Oslo]